MVTGSGGPLGSLDRATQFAEWPVRVTTRSHRLNPLPHAGTISVFLFGIVVLTGLYLTLFFRYGYEGSYDSVAAMEDHAIQRVARALHRYASALLVVTVVVHAWRIFVARRFSGHRRRWRWVSGVVALLLVWLAGVTGYWLVWDLRAQAINEVVIGFLDDLPFGRGLAVDLAVATGPGGSGLLLLIWLAHLGLSAVIGYALVRHLRRSQLSWLPPRHWMALLGGSLLLVSLAVPLGMLGPADPSRLVADLPLDPFVLFLLPPFLSGLRWLAVLAVAVAAGGALLLPRLIERREPPVVEIDPDACTGCELCAADCPYLALTMVDRGTDPETADSGGGLLAVVDPAACVGCGICLGSCLFEAMTLEGEPPLEPAMVGGRRVAIVCDRHLREGSPVTVGEADELVWPVRCAGTFNPDTATDLLNGGAAGLQLVGCPPSDCRYGLGNTIASERARGARRPHLPRRWAGQVAEDWVAPIELDAAIETPGRHPSADALSTPHRRETLIGAGAVVALSVLAVVVATRAPFSGHPDRSAIRVVVDHEPGSTLRSGVTPAGRLGEPVEVVVEAGGEPVGAERLPTDDGRALGLVDVDVPAGASDIEVRIGAVGDGELIPIPDGPIAAGRRLVVDARDEPPPPGAAEGERIFNSRAAACNVCHSVVPGEDREIGPSLAGVATVAGDRVEGLDAAQYLRQSLLLPDQYIVPGYPPGQMLPIYRDQLTPAELDALIEYLLTLEDGS